MITDEELKQMECVKDVPSKSDFLWEDFIWDEYVEWGTKKIVDQVKIKVRDQYDQKDTYKACSAYGATAIYNWYQSVEFMNQWLEFEQEDPRWKWEAYQATRWYPDKWASLQEIMTFFKNRWLIDWYVKTKNVEETKNAIKNWYLIYTGSDKCWWSATSKAKEFVYDANGAAHCFSIIDYDDTWFIAINSFWEDWGDKGLFHINFDKYQYIYSTYALIDHDDRWKIDELVYKMEFEKAIELWITNWTRPDEPMTRREWAVMNYRVLKKVLDMLK